MPEAAWISIVITIVLFVLSHIIVTVWWASRVNTVLEIVQKSVESLIVELKATRESSFGKEEAIREFTLNQKEHDAIWGKIDAMQGHNNKGRS